MIDPWHIRLSRHAVDRYMERRGWAQSYAYRQDAEAALRNLLARCSHQNPPVKLVKGNACRLYQSGDFRFVVSTDQCVVITCHHVGMRPQDRKRRSKAARKARAFA